MRRAPVFLAAGLLALTAAYAIAQEDPIGDVLSRPGSASQPGAAAPPPSPPPSAAAEAPPPAAETVPETVSSPAELPPEPKKRGPVVAKAPTTPPDKRPRYSVAIIQAVDKITAESMRFEAPVGQPVRYENLIFTVRSCEATAADETERDAIANMEVDFQPPAAAGRAAAARKSVYRGWMFAASPSLSPLEHPIYDAWLIACKAA